MSDVLRRMPAEDWRLFESLVVALRGVSGGAGVTVRMVPGAGLVISGGGRGARGGEVGGRGVTCRLTGVGSAIVGMYEAEEVWWDAESGVAGAWVAVPGGLVWAFDDPEDGRSWVGELRELHDTAGLEGDGVTVRRAWLEDYKVDGGGGGGAGKEESGWVFVALGAVLARVTGAGLADGFYEAVQVGLTAGGDPAAVAGGMSFDGAGVGELQEVSLSAGVAADAVVLAERVVDDAGVVRWVFTAGGGGLPAPGLDKHVLQLNGSLEPFWGFARISE